MSNLLTKNTDIDEIIPARVKEDIFRAAAHLSVCGEFPEGKSWACQHEFINVMY